MPLLPRAAAAASRGLLRRTGGAGAGLTAHPRTTATCLRLRRAFLLRADRGGADRPAPPSAAAAAGGSGVGRMTTCRGALPAGLNNSAARLLRLRLRDMPGA